MMICIIILLIIIVIIALFMYNNDTTEYFASYTPPAKNDEEMPCDILCEIPPLETFTPPWLQSDIHNPVYARYADHWFQNDNYNYDYGYQYIRPNGAPLYM